MAEKLNTAATEDTLHQDAEHEVTSIVPTREELAAKRDKVFGDLTDHLVKGIDEKNGADLESSAILLTLGLFLTASNVFQAQEKFKGVDASSPSGKNLEKDLVIRQEEHFNITRRMQELAPNIFADQAEKKDPEALNPFERAVSKFQDEWLGKLAEVQQPITEQRIGPKLASSSERDVIVLIQGDIAEEVGRRLGEKLQLGQRLLLHPELLKPLPIQAAKVPAGASA